MESDTNNIAECSSDAEILCPSTVSVDFESNPDLSFNVKKDVIKTLQELGRYEKNAVKGCSCIGRLWSVSTISRDNIIGVIHHVNGHNCPQCLVSMLEGLRSAGYFTGKSGGSQDLWNTSCRLLECLCLFSKYSEEFCRSLVNSGIIKILEENFKQFTDKRMLKDKNSKPFFIVKATMCLVKNLAKNLSTERATFRKCFLTHLNHHKMVEELCVFATIGSVLLCNRCEAKQETESRCTTVPCLVYWLNQSFEMFNDPTSWTAMYNLPDATDAIWILANFGSASRFCESIVLHSFHQIIKTSSLPEQIQTVEIIWVLCFDLQFAEFIKGDKIVKTMRLKERSDMDLKLLRRLNAVLTILRERYFTRSISLEGNETSSASVAQIVYHTNNVDAAQNLYKKLMTENVSAHLNDPGESDSKYFETVVSWMQKCYCVIICASEFTELDYDSRTILFIAQKLHKDIIAVFVNRDIQLKSWVYHDLKDKPCFDFIESPFYVQDLCKLLVDKSIRFSRKMYGLRNTRSLGSLTGQSKLSMLSDCSDSSRTSCGSVGDIGKQSSSDRTSCSSFPQSSLSSNPTSASPFPGKSLSFEYPNDCVFMPEKIKVMKKKDVSGWLKGLNIGINVRDFKDVNGSVLWELVTACQTCDPSDEKSYDEMIEQFNLTIEQKAKFTDALLKLSL